VRKRRFKTQFPSKAAKGGASVHMVRIGEGITVQWLHLYQALLATSLPGSKFIVTKVTVLARTGGHTVSALIIRCAECTQPGVVFKWLMAAVGLPYEAARQNVDVYWMKCGPAGKTERFDACLHYFREHIAHAQLYNCLWPLAGSPPVVSVELPFENM
jgi:hypothetical protein